MILAGIKKEFKLFTRGFKMWGILILIVGIAAAYPLLYKSMEAMTDQLAQMSSQMGAEMDSTVGSMNAMMDELAMLYGGSMAGVGFYTALSSFTSEGFLVIALLLMATAGGEQKKRSVIIPNCAGLTPAGYVMPKFIIYPLLMALLTFGGTLLTAVISDALFEGSVAMENVLFSGVCVSLYMLFMISIYFLFGLCTGRPGIGVVVMYLGASLIPILLSAFNIDSYNPFALRDMLMTQYADADMNNFILSIVVTVTLSVICCVLSLLVATLRKIDNSAGEANL